MTKKRAPAQPPAKPARPMARAVVQTKTPTRPRPKESRVRVVAAGGRQATAADIPGTSEHAMREMRRRNQADEPVRRARGIRVEATKDGYYGHSRRRAGDVFTIRTEQEFSKKWMRKIDASTRESITTPNEVIRQKHDETLALKYGDRGAARGQSLDDPAYAGEDEDLEDDDNPLGAE